GLVPTAEPGRWQAWLDQVRARIEASIDLDRLLEIARGAPSFNASTQITHPSSFISPPSIIAIARDEAFSFIYEENLDLLRAAGAELAFFSPLHDQALPVGTRAIYLCGGFPELYAEQLCANQPMLDALRAAAATGTPIYAECGGLMYLTEAVVDADGRAFPLVGLLPGRSTMTGRLTLGYRTVQAQADSWLWRAGETVRGHEFHYSLWDSRPEGLPWLYQCLPDAMRPMLRPEGAQLGSILASYVHLHFLACPELATRFVAAAQARTVNLP
ncbi:MAG: cobyrinate a,c-diamide synthase, partial [Oscillochloris sp.]|nr:cobyrinate a,c-diamide synthase [Oscillochloris sp.]